jgi:hypothetical protein
MDCGVDRDADVTPEAPNEGVREAPLEFPPHTKGEEPPFIDAKGKRKRDQPREEAGGDEVRESRLFEVAPVGSSHTR